MNETNEQGVDAGRMGAGRHIKVAAQVAAIVLAVSVVSYLVWDAQRVADRQDGRTPGVVPAGGANDGGAAGRDEATGGENEVLLPSSERLTLSPKPDVVLLPSSKSRVVDDSQSFFTDGSDITLSGSKSGVLPSSKFLVLPSPEMKALMLDAAKNHDEEKQAEKEGGGDQKAGNAQDTTKPKASGSGK